MNNALFTFCGEWYTEEGTEEGFIGTLKSLLNAAPTIDAIPVEWLKEQRKQNEPNSVEEIVKAFTVMCIDTILTLWKEQEGDNGLCINNNVAGISETK